MHDSRPQRSTKIHLADVAVQHRWNRMRASVYAPLDISWALFAGLLAYTGYPAWRVGAFVAILAISLATQAYEVWRSRRSPEAGLEARARVDTVGFGLALAGIAVSGGLRSPLLVHLATSVPVLMVQHGWGRAAQLRVMAINLGLIALAVVPAAWTGPVVTGPAYAVIACVAVGTTVMTSSHCLAVLLGAAHTSIHDAFRAREEVAEHALARARDLEHIGAKLSHELKNPLGAIKALVQLSARAPEGADNRERLQVVETEVERMQAILQDYLSFSRPLEKLHRHAVDLASLVDEVIAVLEARATEAGVRLRRRGSARAHADPRRVKEALINLVANALEASPAKGLVDIDIADQDDRVRILIRDSGRGMSEEVLARVGTPFFTTREEGTGLGVALARAAFAQHGGTLEYTSSPGKGTVACATLPVRAEGGSHGALAGGR